MSDLIRREDALAIIRRRDRCTAQQLFDQIHSDINPGEETESLILRLPGITIENIRGDIALDDGSSWQLVCDFLDTLEITKIGPGEHTSEQVVRALEKAKRLVALEKAVANLVAKAEKMRVEKIASLRKQIEKLERMVF